MIISKIGYVRLSFIYVFLHVLKEVSPTLKAHLNALQEVGAHPLSGVCWHFTHVRRWDAAPSGCRACCGRRCQLAGQVAGYPKPVQRVEIRVVRIPLFFASQLSIPSSGRNSVSFHTGQLKHKSSASKIRSEGWSCAVCHLLCKLVSLTCNLLGGEALDAPTFSRRHIY